MDTYCGQFTVKVCAGSKLELDHKMKRLKSFLDEAPPDLGVSDFEKTRDEWVNRADVQIKPS